MFLFIGQKNFSKKISFEGGCLEVGLWRGTGRSGWWNRGTGWKVWPLQRCVTSVCSVANGLKGIYPGMEEKERSRKRGFFFVCVPIVFGSLYREVVRDKRASFNKGKTGEKHTLFNAEKLCYRTYDFRVKYWKIIGYILVYIKILSYLSSVEKKE